MKQFIFGAVLYSISFVANANCDQLALAAAVSAQDNYEFNYQTNYGEVRFYENQKEQAIYLDLFGKCAQFDPAIATVKVQFSDLKNSCSNPVVSSFSCRYLP